MKSVPRVGLSHDTTFLVDAETRITFADTDMPAVLSTPSLILRLEFTARDLLDRCCLEPHERSVGTSVEIDHLAPTPDGFTVTCRARVIHVAGEVITFQVEAHDGIDMIARGVHKRRVIDAGRFKRRVERKRSSRP
jgi:predicted thioesterase